MGKILIACEESQIVTKAFRALGLEAYSCDLLPCSGGMIQWHIQGDAVEEAYSGKYQMMIAHPPCTYLTVTGNKWMKPEFKDRFPDRAERRENAIAFFIKLFYSPIPMVAIENPVGVISSRFRKPNQYVQPFHFGDPHSKKTGWWLKGLPKLVPTKTVTPHLYIYKNGKRSPQWHMNTLHLPKEERMKIRSKTFPGMADAIASQWGSHLIAEAA